MPNVNTINSKYFFIILWIIVLISFILRVWGVDFGLPYEYHVDEVQYVRQAASMGERGLEPAAWNNPPFFKYILLVEYGTVYVVGRILGLFSSPSNFGAIYVFDPTVLYLLARGTNAILGSMTVFLMGLMGRHFHNSRVGLISAWFLGACFLHIRDSHFAVNDILVTFFITATIFAGLKILFRNENKWYAAAGLFIGLGFATKYTAIFSFVPVIFAHFLSGDVGLKNFSGLRLNKLLLCVIVAFGSSILASPFFVITPQKVFDGMYEFLYLPGKLGFDGWQIDPAGGYVFYIKSLLWGLGYGLLLMIFVGLVASVVNRSKQALVILSLPIVLYLFVGHQQMYFSRFIIPAIPPLLLWSAKVLDDLLAQRISAKRLIYIFPALLTVLTVQPLVNSIKLDLLLEEADTRTLAKEWIEDHVPDGSRFAFDWPVYAPPISSLEKKYPGSEIVYDVRILEGSGLFDETIVWYSEQGFDYIVVSSFISGLSLEDEEKNRQRKLFYDSLDNELELVKTFSPGRGDEQIRFVFDELYSPFVSIWERERPGPMLKIYRVPKYITGKP